MRLSTHLNKMRLLDQTLVGSWEAEVDTTGEKGKDIEDHLGLELVEDNKQNYEHKEKETEHVLKAIKKDYEEYDDDKIKSYVCWRFLKDIFKFFVNHNIIHFSPNNVEFCANL